MARGDERARELQTHLWRLIQAGIATAEQRRLYGFITQRIDRYERLPQQVDGNVHYIESQIKGHGWLSR